MIAAFYVGALVIGIVLSMVLAADEVSTPVVFLITFVVGVGYGRFTTLLMMRS